MKNVYVKPRDYLRKFFPFVRKLRYWAWKFHDRISQRLVISGGTIQFLDAELNFPENIALNYSTPLFWNGPEAYEFWNSRTVALLAGKSKLFLDIGANVGIYSVYVGVKHPQVRVYGFEPVRSIWEKNRAFHRANHLSEDAVLNLALSDRNGPQKIFMPVYSANVEEEQTATLNANSWQAREEKVQKLEVQCSTLDSFAAAHTLPDGPCVLKIDVENCEAAVLRGGRGFIASRRPWIVCEILPCEEFDGVTRTKRNNNGETLTVLQELNYTAFAITGDGFCRMNRSDFSRPHGARDFLLVPGERIPPDLCFFALENISELFRA